MSSIIDGMAFSAQNTFPRESGSQAETEALPFVFKNFVFVQIANSGKQYWIQRYFVEKDEFQIKIQLGTSANNFIIRITELEESHYKTTRSRHQQILILKQIVKNSSNVPIQSTYFLRCGCLVMKIAFKFDLTELAKISFVLFYNQVISKQLLQFWNFTKKYVRPHCNSTEVDRASELHLELRMSQALNTTLSNFQISEEKTQYKSAIEKYGLQKKQIDKINQNIVKSDGLQETILSLFNNYPQEAKSDWMKSNFLRTGDSLRKKLKPLLTLVRSREDRKIQQFTYNMVKAQINNILPVGVGEGGSSFIYLAKVFLTFINSTDYKMYLQNDEKVQRYVAIKKLKPGLEDKLRDKLKHEKSIVSTLKGGTSPFIARYYGTEQGLEISNSLLMQFVQGEELNVFLHNRQSSISLWSKLYLLLNIVHGIRHLISYEIVHFDLKPMNIMVCRYMITKIIDFGQAYSKDVCDSGYCPGYTFPYAAPQVLQRFHNKQTRKKNKQSFEFSQKQDVFAFGIIMAEVLFNTKIFYLSNDAFKAVYLRREMLQRVMLAVEELQSYGNQTALSTLAFIIVRCLDPDPQKRPYFDWVGIALKLILNSYSGN